VVDSDGRSNFAFEDDGEQAAQAPPIVVVDGSLKYLNERSGAVFAASDVDVTLSRSGLSGPLEVDGAFNWNDQRLTIAFHAGSSARLVADGSPADFTIAGPYLNAAFSGRAALRRGSNSPEPSSSRPMRWPTFCPGPATRAGLRPAFRHFPPAARSISPAAPSASRKGSSPSGG
jgi:hypothetical protein